jgi:ABC-type uncharacterized transport system ATPase subunit
VENIADYIGIMNEGELVISCELEELKRSVKRARLIFKKNKLPDEFPIPGVINRSETEHEVVLTLREFGDATFDNLKQLAPDKIDIENMQLEDIFIALA